MKFATKLTQHYPPNLKYVATLPWEIKNSNFLQVFSRYEKCKQIAFFASNLVVYPQILIF